MHDEYEIDPVTGKLRPVELHQNTIVQTGINRNLLYTKAEVDAKIANSGGGGVKTIVAGTNITVNSSDPANPIVSSTGGGGSGITRSINVVSTPTTAGATALTDYIYIVTGTTTITLPTAVSNTNRYTVTNAGSNTVTVATTGGQTIVGSATVTLPITNMSLDFVSNNTNWTIE